MNRYLRLGLTATAAAFLFALAACNTSSSTTSGDGSGPVPGNANSIGQRAPEIEGVPVYSPIPEDASFFRRRLANVPIKLSNYRGKVVLLDFWATWCGPCIAAIPREKQLVARLRGRPFALIGISIDDNRETLQKFLRTNALPWPNILDEGKNIGMVWDIEAVPTFVLISAEGVVVGRWEGAQDMPEIERAVERELEIVEKKK